jgi:hypothetical protein
MALPAAAAASIPLSTPVWPHARRHECIKLSRLGASRTASCYLAAPSQYTSRYSMLTHLSHVL